MTPPPLKQCCAIGKLLLDGKVNIVQGEGAFFQEFTWQSQDCEGVSKLLTKIVVVVYKT